MTDDSRASVQGSFAPTRAILASSLVKELEGAPTGTMQVSDDLTALIAGLQQLDDAGQDCALADYAFSLIMNHLPTDRFVGLQLEQPEGSINFIVEPVYATR